MSRIGRIRRLPLAMLAMVVLLCLTGLFTIDIDGDEGRKQMVWLVASIGVMVLTASVSYRRLGEWSYVIFGVSLATLVAVFVMPDSISPSINGARRWICVPMLPEARFQPSELAKVAYIMMLAWYLRFRNSYRTLRGLLVPFALTLVPLALVLKEPDLGTSMLFLPTLFAMLFMAGANGRHLLAIIALGGAMVVGVVFVQVFLPMSNPSMERFAPLKQYQDARIREWLNRYGFNVPVVRDKSDQVDDSLKAIGSGGAVGQHGPDAIYTNERQIAQPEPGAGDRDANSSHVHKRKIPEGKTDFIFSLVAHEGGFVVCLILLAAYMIIFASGVEIAASTADPFGRLLAVGVVALFAAQTVINIGMATYLLPVTGMTLPFVSYGGSSLLVNFAALGLLINVHLRRPIVLYRRRFEWRDDIEALT